MEILPIFIQSNPSEGGRAVLLILGGLGGCYALGVVLWRGARKAFRAAGVAVERAGLFKTLLAIAIPSTTAVGLPEAKQIRVSKPSRPPWLATSGFPSPRSLVRAEGHNADPHRSPLFPAAGRDRTYSPPRAILHTTDPKLQDILQERRKHRAAAMDRHPSESLARDPKLTHHTVMPGDTLWDIAGQVLATKDQARIARYWPMIHRENREIIGADPNLLNPGQVLSLPPLR
jgi:nucleoid-associated protein YgaU